MRRRPGALARESGLAVRSCDRARGADITTDLRGALAPVKARNFAAIIEPARGGELLRAIHGYQDTGR